MSSSLDMHDLPRYRGAARKLPSANAHFSTELREVREELNVVGDALLLGCEAAGATTKRGVSGSFDGVQTNHNTLHNTREQRPSQVNALLHSFQSRAPIKLPGTNNWNNSQIVTRPTRPHCSLNKLPNSFLTP
eukprot:scpid58885/ scgid0912/ 